MWAWFEDLVVLPLIEAYGRSMDWLLGPMEPCLTRGCEFVHCLYCGSGHIEGALSGTHSCTVCAWRNGVEVS